MIDQNGYFSKFSKESEFFSKFWLKSKFFANKFDFGHNFRKISILVKFSKNYVLGKVLEKLRFRSSFRKITF